MNAFITLFMLLNYLWSAGAIIYEDGSYHTGSQANSGCIAGLMCDNDHQDETLQREFIHIWQNRIDMQQNVIDGENEQWFSHPNWTVLPKK